jgi:NitT/TauT family transport system permease protein
MFRLPLEKVIPWIVILVFFAVWQAGCELFKVPVFILPSPVDVVAELFRSFGAIWFHAQSTLIATLTGFAFAIAAGLLLGILVGSSKLAYHGLYPLLIGINSVPKVAIVPVLVIWFGIGVVPAVLTSFLMSFFPIAVNVATGLATVEPEMEDVLRSLGASRIDIIRKVGLPRSMPYFFASLKVAITLAFVGSIVAESVASSRGIGMLMVRAASDFNTPLVFAGLVLTAIMGIVFYVLFAFIERRSTSWANRSLASNG